MQEQLFRNKITRVSFVLMIFVVSIHTYNVDVYKLNGNTDALGGFVRILEYYIRFLERACVPFFFMISGYLFFRNYSPDKLIIKYKSRMKTILVPYLIWCTVYYLYYVCLTRIPWLKSRMNRPVVEFSNFEWLKWLWTEQYYTLWFMKDLIILILFTPLIYFILKQDDRKGCFKYVGVLVIILTYLEKSGMLFGFYNPLDFHYLVGAYIGINCRELPLMHNRKVTHVSLIMIVLLMIYGAWCVRYGIEWGLLTILLFCICVWFGSNIFGYDGESQWWMQITFFCYCMHDLVLEALEKIFLVIFGNGSLFALIDYLCMPFITIIICTFTAYILKRYMPRIWSVLTGDRG